MCSKTYSVISRAQFDEVYLTTREQYEKLLSGELVLKRCFWLKTCLWSVSKLLFFAICLSVNFNPHMTQPGLRPQFEGEAHLTYDHDHDQ